MAAYSGEGGREMLEKVSFGQKNGLKRTLAEPQKSHFPPKSPIFRPQASFFRSQALFPARHAPLSRLISLHERRSRNMMARVVQPELSALSNFI